MFVRQMARPLSRPEDFNNPSYDDIGPGMSQTLDHRWLLYPAICQILKSQFFRALSNGGRLIIEALSW